jgi:hypothetical protein
MFNLSIPALPDAIFVYVDKNNDDTSVSWSPHADLAPGIRNRLINAVSRLSKTWLMPPQDGEVFDIFEAGQQRVLEYSLATGF